MRLPIGYAAALGLLTLSLPATGTPLTTGVGTSGSADTATSVNGSKVALSSVSFPEGKADKRRTRNLNNLLRAAIKKADFGRANGVQIHVRVAELEIEESNDLVRVRCTLVGRIQGGPTARSHISFGGHPKKRLTLEKEVMRMVSDGVVTRLAQLAKDRAQKDAPEDESEDGPESAF